MTLGTGLQKVTEMVAEGILSVRAGENLRLWLTEKDYSVFVSEILELIDGNDPDDLEDRFRTTIEFGTGGIRGTMGAGPNRINIRTIGEAAQGLAQYVKNVGGSEAADQGIVVAYDTRNNSYRFARETAAIIAGNGIVVHLFPEARATPQLSFAVRALAGVAGVVISASHNPPSDNGFKVYWSDGGQVVSPHDKKIIAEVRAVGEIVRCDFNRALEVGLVRLVDSEIDTRYVSCLARLTLTDAREVRLVYTPLHGVGMTSVAAVLQELGYRDLHIVEEQAVQDGNFPTVRDGIANPEDPRSFSLAVRKAAEVDADLAIASDPDADRFGCAVPHPEKGWNAPLEELALTGNQIGALLCHYILSQKQARCDLPEKGLVCETAVTTDLVGVIARSFGVKVVHDLLIGFKYIGATINAKPEDTEFLFGTEESHGYLADDAIRDKEAATGVLLVECAAVLKAQGQTLWDYLDEIYRTYGYFQQVQTSTCRDGAEGVREIAAIMGGLRRRPPEAIGGHRVVDVIDRSTGQTTNLSNGARRPVAGDAGNLLIFSFTEAGHTRVAVRPSGTEPKIKYYISASSRDIPELVSEDWEATRAAVDAFADDVVSGILSAAEKALTA